MKSLYFYKGFTLLETIVSVAILAIVIVGPLAALSNSSSYARQSKDSMTASYIAEEAIELLENRYDSLYLLCKKQPEIALCTPQVGETSGNVSWRLFKEQLNSKDNLGIPNGQPSCFKKKEDGSDDNPAGCSYDFESMTGAVESVPVRYLTTDTECPYLVEITTKAVVGGGETETLRKSVRSYVCKGIAGHITGAISTSTRVFSRSVTLEALPTFETGSMFTQYNDDIRVTSTVNFRGVNGFTYAVRVVRFMHSQP